MTAPIIGLGVVAALGAGVLFVVAKARAIDVALAVVGYGGFFATIAAMGPYFSAGPYLFVALATVFTAMWMLATVRVVQYRGPMKWRWNAGESNRKQT